MWVLHADDPDLLPGVPPNDFEKLDMLLDLIIPSISFGKGSDRRQRSFSGATQKRMLKAAQELELHKIMEKEDDISSPRVRHQRNATPIKL